MALSQETTAQLQALAPFVLPSGLGSHGVHVGTDLWGRPFYYDPIGMYGQEGSGLHDPNVLVLGQIGMGKSALLKLLSRRLSVLGYGVVYLDPKGETDRLASAFGSIPIRLAPGGHTRINPFDLASHSDSLSLGLVLETVVAAMLERPLTLLERKHLSQALTRVHERQAAAPTTLADLHDELDGVAPDLQLGLWTFVHGSGRGLFDGLSTVHVDRESRLVVADLSSLLEVATTEHVRSAVLVLVAAWLAHVLLAIERRCLLILDEAWSLLREPATAMWLRRQWKLARALGCANVAVLHRLSDLKAAGANADLAQGLLADTQTRIIFRQPASELELVTEWLGLNSTEAEAVLALPRGWALWKAGHHTSVVGLDVLPSEAALIDTDSAMRPDGD